MGQLTKSGRATRKVAFVITATDQGTLILNRFDRHQTPDSTYGSETRISEHSVYSQAEVNRGIDLLDLRRRGYGDGVVVIDGGANIGVHTIAWATHMTGWGSVVSIEPQERIYYALAGNIAINNCFNARAIHAAVAAAPGVMKMPAPDYSAAASFGSLELRKRPDNEFIGQTLDYSDGATVEIRTISLNSLGLGRVDLIKLDIEGMELDALEGTRGIIERDRPILIVEKIKNNQKELRSWLERSGYLTLQDISNFVAIHHADKCLELLNAAKARGELDWLAKPSP